MTLKVVEPTEVSPAVVLERKRPLVTALKNRLRWVIDWLPEGRTLPDDVWARRNRWISWFALAQAFGLGVYGLIRGISPTTCGIEVLIVAVPAVLGMGSMFSRRMRTNTVTVSLMFASATLVDLSDGVTEAHFHFFVMLGVVSLYQDWVAFGICVLITVFHHAVMGEVAPASVYGRSSEAQDPIKWALIHGSFVLAASVTHLIAWKSNEQQELSDPLTRLPNRTAFIEELSRRLAAPDRVVSVLFVDLDNFKSLNDSAGHHVGDLALRHAASRMSSVVYAPDMVARLGGDEFAVLVHGDAAVAAQIGERIVAQLQPGVPIEGRDIFVKASVGVADSGLAGSRDSADLMRDADLAMYLAKSSGKNQVFTYTAGLDTVVRDRASLASDIRSALADGQFEVYYQPVMRRGAPPQSGLYLDGVEALLRWHHPERGMVPPTDFVPLAEETGEIEAIGAWVLTTAVMQIMQWRRELPGCEELTVAVNLSPVQMRNPELVSLVSAALAASGLPACSLTLEVTEGVLLHDLDAARRQLDGVRALGVLVAIDDFGTGYSSLAYLGSLPADQLKIDRSFTANLADGSGSALVRGIIDLARGMELDILAEGVEVREQQEILRELGCPASQGYLYSRPLCGSDFAEFADTRRWERAS
ncbi:diguanylate cyclase (GGDEF)-like protein [Jatrophihabitans sp. GAS493]|uniref:putative bifunctional diguanylate cyclase/phosphodiesterase n=1 Tax=Jatrophihabitans sp. GAS493 TaxID=1907575 RepID=UPI000BB6D6BB|nr:bifunctional diguanylate cyclase/phosphodiesterase [Jatrophihabitans sp. GAS493]SOD72484.1 diguanylate cyclase (GGDEF)-like protein [Jatrophihabitans sp. GAS493]